MRLNRFFVSGYRRQASNAEPGMTLIELLVVFLIIAMTMAMLVPALAKARHKAKGSHCAGNLRQMVAASLMYAADNNGQFIPDTIGCPPNTWVNGNDDLSWLHPGLIPSTKIFVCPGTKNEVRTNLVFDLYNHRTHLKDLLDNAFGGAQGTNGHSYEVIGAIHTNKLTQTLVENYVLQYHPTLKGTKPGPEAFWLFFDQDDAAKNNVWNKPDNHGVAGGNVAYCDGHVAWLSSSQHDEQWRITLDSR